MPLRPTCRMGRKLVNLCCFAAFVLLMSALSMSYRRAIKLKWESSAEKLSFNPTSGLANESALHLAGILGPLFDEFPPSASVFVLEGGKGIKSDLWPARVDAELMDQLQLSFNEALFMAEAHSGFLKGAADRLPNYVPPKNVQPQGIVTVGGDAYFPPLMVSLRLLRRTGSTLPVEVFLPKQDYEAALCEEVLPTLNAVCRIFPASRESELDISHYQFKIFAILFSSFKEVLWLDADNFPLHDVASLFSSKPFKNTGLVTWPDIWQTTVSPAYYLVSSQHRVSVSKRASTESGQLLVSKAKHWQTLLLTAYYNYYGPANYYSMLCQGGAGCGDKDTFLPAAEALGLPFYDVKAPAQAVGHRKNDRTENIYRFALIQHDPTEDYEITLELEKTKKTEGNANATAPTSAYDAVRPFFLHMSVPKWDAFHVFDHVGAYDLTRDSRKNPAPAFRDPADAATKIKGVERMVWEETKWVGCNLEQVIRYWQPKRGHICEKLEAYFNDVLDVNQGKTMGLGLDIALVPAIESSG